jgi:hypothetical protein
MSACRQLIGKFERFDLPGLERSFVQMERSRYGLQRFNRKLQRLLRFA